LQLEDGYEEEYDYEAGIEMDEYEEEGSTYDDNIYLTLLSLNINFQFPQGTFARNSDRTTVGLGVSYYNNFSKKDDLFWAIHLSNFRIDRLSNSFFVPDAGLGYDLSVRTKTSLIFLGYGLRYYPDFYTPSLEPMVEIRLGGNYIYTYSSETINDSENSDVSFHNSDFSFAYAVGLGFQYNIQRGRALQLMLNYHGGTNGTYFISEDNGFQYPIDNFVRRTTQLDYLQLSVGFTFGF